MLKFDYYQKNISLKCGGSYKLSREYYDSVRKIYKDNHDTLIDEFLNVNCTDCIDCICCFECDECVNCINCEKCNYCFWCNDISGVSKQMYINYNSDIKFSNDLIPDVSTNDYIRESDEMPITEECKALTTFKCVDLFDSLKEVSSIFFLI